MWASIDIAMTDDVRAEMVLALMSGAYKLPLDVICNERPVGNYHNWVCTLCKGHDGRHEAWGGMAFRWSGERSQVIVWTNGTFAECYFSSEEGLIAAR